MAKPKLTPDEPGFIPLSQTIVESHMELRPRKAAWPAEKKTWAPRTKGELKSERMRKKASKIDVRDRELPETDDE